MGYAKYKAERLMDFIKMNSNKLNIPKLIHACERHYHWKEAVFLYQNYDEFDSAANVMMQHSPVAFTHDQFLMVMQKVSNMEIYYRAISFYLQEQPMQLNSLLTTITPKVDHARVVQQIKKDKQLPLIYPYLKTIQQLDLAPVNEALNALYVEGERYDELRSPSQHTQTSISLRLLPSWKNTSSMKCDEFVQWCTRKTNATSNPSSCPRWTRCTRMPWKLQEKVVPKICATSCSSTSWMKGTKNASQLVCTHATT